MNRGATTWFRMFGTTILEVQLGNIVDAGNIRQMTM